MKKPVLHHLSDYFFPHPRNNHRPHLFSVTSVVVLVLAVFLFEAAYFVQTRFVFLQTDFLASVLPGALVALTNEDRFALGLASVTENGQLDAAAQAAAADMAAKGYFSHVSPDGKTPWDWLDEAGYRYRYAGQNLAVNFTDSQNVETAWMESPTHRANIVKSDYTQVGFGTANGMFEGHETTFVVEFFASPAAAPAIAATALVQPASGEVASPRLITPTAPVQVLGTEIGNADKGSTAVPASPNMVERMLASPLSTLIALLTALVALVSISFSVTMFMRGRASHPSVVYGALLLIIITVAAILTSVLAAGPVTLAVGV